MLRISLKCTLILGLVLPVFVSCGEGGPDGIQPTDTDGARPDILLVSIDSLRPDHLSCYGYARATSPNMDRIADEGSRFTNAVSTTSWTLPAHAALFTGLYDSAHGLVDNGLRLASQNHTIAEILKENGYHTAGFYGGPYLHPTYGLAQGFDVYESCMTVLPDHASGDTVRTESMAWKSSAHADVTGPRTLEKVRAWTKQLDSKPFFLFLHLWDVHFDYIPPKRYVDMFDPGYKGDLDVTDYMSNQSVHQEMSERDWKHLLALYDAEIRFTDDILGSIFSLLEHHGRMKDTLVIITADHGEEFFEHGGKGHQRTLYDEVVMVPLIFRWPGHVPSGQTIDHQVRLIDVLPTLVSLLSIPVTSKVQGRDLTSLFSGQQTSEEPALCELLVNQGSLRSLRTHRWKILELSSEGEAGFFDLRIDKGEQHPIPATQPPHKLAREQLRSEYEVSLRLAGEIGGSEPVSVDPGLKEKLESLGYLGGNE